MCVCDAAAGAVCGEGVTNLSGGRCGSLMLRRIVAGLGMLLLPLPPLPASSSSPSTRLPPPAALVALPPAVRPLPDPFFPPWPLPPPPLLLLLLLLPPV